ncbi:hypothetical protein BG011_007194 [Mortierella polycephala]|uniref:GRAM domain-containing protein n=1 Tax=Mortierella polycephala TaxID=41804 RepID=A0A9P6PSV3_9FUNG|nr:hypothetical protein BG011_007194 [Mortierella polycephala]
MNTATQSTHNTLTTQRSKEEVSFQFDRHVQEIRRRRTVAKRGPPPDRDDFTRIEAESGKRILDMRPYLQASLARDDKIKKTEPLQWSKMKALLSRLYDTSNPAQSLGLYVERVMYWRKPSETFAWFILYFTLWFYKLWLPAFISLFAIKILNNRFGFLGNFKEVLDVPAPLNQNSKDKEPTRKTKVHSQLRELIHSKDLTDWISQMTKIWGPYCQALLEENIRYLERLKNLFRWERPEQTWRVLALLSFYIFVSTFFQSLVVPAIGLFIGVEFFILLPMQKYYPRFSHVFSPVEWILWGVPTNAELAVEMLTRHEDEKQRLFEDIGASGTAGSVRHGEDEGDSASFMTGLSPASKIKYEYQKRVRGSSSSNLSILSDAPPTGSLQEESAEFHCLLRGKPGKLVITEDMLQFRSAKILGRDVEAQISWENIDTIKKSKTMNLGIWSMPGINVTDIYGRVIAFQNVVHRDDAFRKLIVTSGKKWSHVS